MDADSQRSIDRRLARIEGQVGGLRRMIESGAYCCDVLTQMAAVRAALNQACAELAASHVKSCMLGHGTDSAHPHAALMSRDELIDELSATLSRMMR